MQVVYLTLTFACVHRVPYLLCAIPVLQGYSKRWAYAKLWMLCEKVALVCIPFYFPERWPDFVGYTVACVIIGVGFLVAVFFRPYADNFETTMDLSSRCALRCLRSLQNF